MDNDRGTGRTTASIQWCINRAKLGEKGIYIVHNLKMIDYCTHLPIVKQLLVNSDAAYSNAAHKLKFGSGGEIVFVTNEMVKNPIFRRERTFDFQARDHFA